MREQLAHTLKRSRPTTATNTTCWRASAFASFWRQHLQKPEALWSVPFVSLSFYGCHRQNLHILMPPALMPTSLEQIKSNAIKSTESNQCVRLAHIAQGDINVLQHQPELETIVEIPRQHSLGQPLLRLKRATGGAVDRAERHLWSDAELRQRQQTLAGLQIQIEQCQASGGNGGQAGIRGINSKRRSRAASWCEKRTRAR